jgi:hypothetical protein
LIARKKRINIISELSWQVTEAFRIIEQEVFVMAENETKETEKKNETVKKKKVWPWILVFAVLVCILVGVYQAARPKTSAGSKDVTLEVVDSEGNTVTYEEKTDAEYLADFMDELSTEDDFSYEAEDSSTGLYLTMVNGEEADYNTDQAYWAIYVNDEYGQYGISEQPVSDGDTFTLKYETAQ